MARIEGTEGKIVEITPTAVMIETSEGLVHVPAMKFNEAISVLLREDK